MSALDEIVDIETDVMDSQTSHVYAREDGQRLGLVRACGCRSEGWEAVNPAGGVVAHLLDFDYAVEALIAESSR